VSFRVIALATLVSIVNQVAGTPYIVGGDSPAGTDCSGLASWIANAATDRPVFGDRFNTGNEEGALLARGFQYGTAPNALVIGWNGGHTAGTLPDGTSIQWWAQWGAFRWSRRLPVRVYAPYVPAVATGWRGRPASATRCTAPATRCTARSGRCTGSRNIRSAAPRAGAGWWPWNCERIANRISHVLMYRADFLRRGSDDRFQAPRKWCSPSAESIVGYITLLRSGKSTSALSMQILP